MANGIPGFDLALSQERSERNLAYLSRTETVLGEQVLQITPLLLCSLVEKRSPFLVGGVVNYPQVAQFLCALSPLDDASSPTNIRRLYESIAHFPLTKCEAEVEEFLAVTFRDQPKGSGPDCAPVASSAAALEYRMKVTFGWDRELTLNTPLRIIYQQLRLWQQEQGQIVINALSQRTKADWQKTLQAALDSGQITAEQISEFQTQQAALFAGRN